MTDRPRLVPLATTLLVTAMFALTHPYGGIRHDGILYLGEALVDLDPARMSHDLFFLFGSQASFSVVPHLYARAIEAMGVGDGTRCLLVASLTLFLLSSAWIASRLCRANLVAWSLVVLSVAAPVYGGQRIFAYGEPFFTARSFAEPLVLFGLGCLLRGRTGAAIAFLLVALTVHPLVGLAGLLFVWCWLVLGDRRWWWAIGLSGVPIVLALIGIAPFDGLFRRYDAEWMAVVEDANSFVFPSNWWLPDWAAVVFDVMVLGWFARVRTGDRPTRRFAQAAIGAGLLGIAGALVGADLMSDVLLTGLQLWRTHWLMHWTAVVVAPSLIVTLWMRETPNDRAAALLLIGALFSLATFGPIALVPGAAALVLFRARVPVSRPLVICLAIFCIGLGASLFTRQFISLRAFAGMLEGSVAVQAARWLSITVVGLALTFVGLRWLPRHAIAVTALAAVLLVVAISGWDQRERWAVFQEDYASQHGLLWNETVRPEDNLYWYREVRAPWLMMRHANFFAPNQSSGVLFNRKTAITLQQRAKLTGLLELQEMICRTMNNLNRKETSCEPDLDVVAQICHAADGLSYMVLQSVLPVRPVGTLRTGFVEHDYEKTFYLYRCADIAAR